MSCLWVYVNLKFREDRLCEKNIICDFSIISVIIPPENAEDCKNKIMFAGSILILIAFILVLLK